MLAYQRIYVLKRRMLIELTPLITYIIYKSRVITNREILSFIMYILHG